MKFNERVEEILEGSELRSLNKLIAKLEDPNYYEEAMKYLRDDFEDNFEKVTSKGGTWGSYAVDQAIGKVNEKYHLKSKDVRLLTDILQSEAYNMMTRG